MENLFIEHLYHRQITPPAVHRGKQGRHPFGILSPLMFQRSKCRKPSLASTLVSLRRPFLSEDRRPWRAKQLSALMAETRFANMSVLASPSLLPCSHGFICSAWFLRNRIVSGIVSDVDCETKIPKLSGVYLLDIFRVGRRAKE